MSGTDIEGAGDGAPGARGPLIAPGLASSLRLPPPLGSLLWRAHRAELEATGERRRGAFRLTRNLLGGARVAGYSLQALADCLGVTASSVRARSTSDGRLSAAELGWLLGLSVEDLARWCDRCSLPRPSADPARRYLASDVVRAVAGAGPNGKDRPRRGQAAGSRRHRPPR